MMVDWLVCTSTYHGLSYQVVYLVTQRDIYLVGPVVGAGREGCMDVSKTGAAPGGQGDRGTFGGEAAGYGGADATRSAGYKSMFALEGQANGWHWRRRA